MPRFTDHAKQRFVERRPDLFPPGIDPPQPAHVIEQLAYQSYTRSDPISRADAEKFLGHRMGVYWGDVFYRLEDGVGIWVAVWKSKGNEEIRTFIIPGEDPEVALHVEGMTGVASF